MRPPRRPYSAPSWGWIGQRMEARPSPAPARGSAQPGICESSGAPFALQKGRSPPGTNSGNYTREIVLIKFIKGQKNGVYWWTADWMSRKGKEKSGLVRTEWRQGEGQTGSCGVSELPDREKTWQHLLKLS